MLCRHLIDNVARDPWEGSTDGQLEEGGRSSDGRRRAPRLPSPAVELPHAVVSMADRRGCEAARVELSSFAASLSSSTTAAELI